VALSGLVSDAEVSPELLVAAWESSLDGALGEVIPTADGRADLLWVGLSTGQHAVTLTATDDQGATCEHQITFVAGTPPEVSLVAPERDEEVPEGTVTFSAKVGDSEDTPDQLSVTFSSDLDGELGSQVGDTHGLVELDVDDLSLGRHTVTAIVTDPAGLADSDETVFYIDGLPSAPTITLTPDPATTENDLVATITSASVDPEGEQISYTWSWASEGKVSAASTDDTLPASATAKGETWSVSVTPSDGAREGAAGTTELTISNATPVVTSAEISPNPAFIDEPLTCSWGGWSDPDGDADQSTVEWAVDGTSAGTDTTLDAGLIAGASVTCTVTAFDGTEDGTSVTAELTISNSPPSVGLTIIDPNPATASDVLSCEYFGYTDADGDTDQSEILWTVDGAIAGSSSTLAGAAQAGEEVVCAVTPYDGSERGEAVSDSLTITNSAPSITDVTISPDPATAFDSLLCEWSGFSDPDGHADQSTVEWTVNGVDFGASTTLAAGFVHGDTVTCTVTPYDGYSAGTARSASLVISNTPPELIGVSLSPSQPGTEDVISALVTGTDMDGDELTFTYEWTLDGGALSESSSSLDGAIWFERGDEIGLTVTPFDGYDDGDSASATAVTVVNTPPTAPTVELQPAMPTAGQDDLFCDILTDSDDDDSDPISYSFSWIRDGANWFGSTSTTDISGDTIAAADLLEGERWECEATPNDGYENGTAGRSTATVTSPNNCTAVEMDGVDDYLYTTASADFLYPTGEYTAEAWVRWSGTGSTTWQYILSHGQSDVIFRLGVESGQLAYATDGVVLTTSMPLDEWVHVAAVYDGSIGRLFVDGGLMAMGAATSPNSAAPEATLYIGDDASGVTSAPWDGWIDEVHISSAARYTTTFNPDVYTEPDADTVALWHFDEAAGVYALDSSSNGHDAILDGPTWSADSSCDDTP